MRLRRILAPGAGALAWVAILGMRLVSVTDWYWIARDDAVITLSHARNAAEFGSIGVSPGGDRVEAFSSPLHFGIAYLAHLVSSPSARTLSIAIMLVSVIGTGAATVLVLRAVAERSGMSSYRSDVVAVVAATCAAIPTAASWTSVGWIGSGMENPIVICSGMAVVAATTTMVRPRIAQILLIVSLVLFLLSRVEFAALAAPLVIVTASVNAARWAGRARVAFCQTVGATALLVGSVHVARRLYFGDWLPHTARVQERRTGFNEVAFIGVVSAIVLMLFATAVLKRRSLPTWQNSIVRLALSIGTTLLAVVLVWLDASGRTAASVLAPLVLLPVALLVVSVLVLLQVQRFVAADTQWTVNHVFAALTVVPLAQYVVTGPARLDEFRIAVIAVPVLAAWACALVVMVGSAEAPAALGAVLRHRYARFTPVGLGVIALVVGAGWIFRTDRPRLLNYEITRAPDILEVVHDVRDERLAGDGLVILANPDLGKVSYDKTAAMVDLGLLGDPLLFLVVSERPALVATYLGQVARPDVIETHSHWSCQYGEWLQSPDFAQNYVLSDTRWLEGRDQAPGCLIDGKWAIWLRSDADAEYELTRELIESPDPVAAVRDALTECSRRSGGVFRCQDVRRALQRAAGAMRAAGTFAPALEELNASPSAPLDIPMLERGANWGPRSFHEFVRLVNT